MTTKSTSNGPGPSKFRKDAAIFSPSNYNPASAMNYGSNSGSPANSKSSPADSNFQNPQMHMTPQMMQMNPQMMQMQMNPQMMQMQMNPQMMQMHPHMMQMHPQMMQMNMGMGMGVNVTAPDMYNSYNPYMSQPQYEFNPYSSPMQYGSPNYPYVPMSPMYGNHNNVAGKNGRKKHYKSTSTTPRSSSFKSNEDSPSATEITEQWDGDKPEADDSMKHEPESDSVPASSSPAESTPDFTPQVESTSTSASASEEPVILKNLPFYVNTDYEDFAANKTGFERRKHLFGNNKAVLEDRDLVIKNNQQEIINYNIPSKHINGEKADTTGAKTNWASVLTSSVKPNKVKKDSKSMAPPVSSDTQSSQKSPIASSVPTNPPIPAQAVEEVDSVGLLSLKKMFNCLGDPSLDDVQFKITSRGLTNTGNICYMNSILQVLMYCQPFNNLFKILDMKSVGSLHESKTPLVDATIGLFNEFSQNSTKSLSPESFYMKLINNSKFSHLKWGQQEDAEEFLGYLLDGLHEEFIKSINDISKDQLDNLLNKINPIDTETRLQVKSAIKIIKKLNNHSGNNGVATGKTIPSDEVEEEDEDRDINEDNGGWNEIGSKNQKVSSKRTVEIEPSPIKTIFGGQFRSVLQIPHKKDQSITLDPFQCIQLDISNPDVNTIEEAFKQLNEPEQIPFKLNDNREVVAKKQTFIDNLPPVLIIHLKRFKYDHSNNGNIEKLKKKIAYGNQLTIPSELFSNWRKHINKDYKLTGVVYHHGMGAEGGHYTCDVLRPTEVSNVAMNRKEDEDSDKPKRDDGDEWIRIDDTMINEINNKDALNGDDDIKNAYILFYQKL